MEAQCRAKAVKIFRLLFINILSNRYNSQPGTKTLLCARLQIRLNMKIHAYLTANQC